MSDQNVARITVSVPENAKLWVDDVQLEEVPKTTPLEDGAQMAPVNLDFEEAPTP